MLCVQSCEHGRWRGVSVAAGIYVKAEILEKICVESRFDQLTCHCKQGLSTFAQMELIYHCERSKGTPLKLFVF
jgi:hypothetical protein